MAKSYQAGDGRMNGRQCFKCLAWLMEAEAVAAKATTSPERDYACQCTTQRKPRTGRRTHTEERVSVPLEQAQSNSSDNNKMNRCTLPPAAHPGFQEHEMRPVINRKLGGGKRAVTRSRSPSARSPEGVMMPLEQLQRGSGSVSSRKQQ